MIREAELMDANVLEELYKTLAPNIHAAYL
jgi:hypothetical protein